MRILFFLVLTFFVAFFTTTLLLDGLCQSSGYYDEGRADSVAVANGD